MTATSSGQAFAVANAAMVRGVDAASTVHVLLADCVGLLSADNAGVLVRIGQAFETLAATSHRAEALELYQSQAQAGPCVEAMESGASITVAGPAALAERWPDFARAMSAAGLQTVHSEPMRWHGHVLGGVNLFWDGERRLSDADRELARAFSDICSLALMQGPSADDPVVVADLVRAALRGRVGIERAKGVLAESEDLDMGQAFQRLMELSQESGRPLATVADEILRDVVARRRP